MITLLTGLPGNGKGVYGIDWLMREVAKENQRLLSEGKPERPVYYSGITDCRVPGWVELDDPMQWFRCPPGSYILIDECQRIFRTRANGSSVPPHVAELETHRHNGHDLLLITQHPMLIDQNIRRLVGRHFHIVRKFGRESAVVHEWNKVVEQPHKSRTGSIRHDYKYNKQVYGLYKSAEVHTVKKTIPLRYYFIFVAPVLVIGLLYVAFQQLKPSNMADNISAVAPGAIGADGMPLPAGTQTRAKPEPDYLAARVPRIAAFPATAPVYDEITKPVTAPVPAACVLSKSKGCNCFTQQATPLQVDDHTCRQIVANGYFQDFDNGILKYEQQRVMPEPVSERTAYEAPARGEPVAPAPVGGQQAASSDAGERIPANIVRDSMRQSKWAYKAPGGNLEGMN